MTSIQGLSALPVPMVHISIKQKVGNYLIRKSLKLLTVVVVLVAAVLMWAKNGVCWQRALYRAGISGNMNFIHLIF